MMRAMMFGGAFLFLLGIIFLIPVPPLGIGWMITGGIMMNKAAPHIPELHKDETGE